MSVDFTVKWPSGFVMIRRMFWSGMPKRRVGFVLTDMLFVLCWWEDEVGGYAEMRKLDEATRCVQVRVRV